jgi:hypothetical protein
VSSEDDDDDNDDDDDDDDDDNDIHTQELATQADWATQPPESEDTGQDAGREATQAEPRDAEEGNEIAAAASASASVSSSAAAAAADADSDAAMRRADLPCTQQDGEGEVVDDEDRSETVAERAASVHSHSRGEYQTQSDQASPERSEDGRNGAESQTDETQEFDWDATQAGDGCEEEPQQGHVVVGGGAEEEDEECRGRSRSSQGGGEAVALETRQQAGQPHGGSVSATAAVATDDGGGGMGAPTVQSTLDASL